MLGGLGISGAMDTPGTVTTPGTLAIAGTVTIPGTPTIPGTLTIPRTLAVPFHKAPFSPYFSENWARKCKRKKIIYIYINPPRVS